MVLLLCCCLRLPFCLLGRPFFQTAPFLLFEWMCSYALHLFFFSIRSEPLLVWFLLVSLSFFHSTPDPNAWVSTDHSWMWMWHAPCFSVVSNFFFFLLLCTRALSAPPPRACWISLGCFPMSHSSIDSRQCSLGQHVPKDGSGAHLASLQGAEGEPAPGPRLEVVGAVSGSRIATALSSMFRQTDRVDWAKSR